jgi:rRNA maturation RNase YbeY
MKVKVTNLQRSVQLDRARLIKLTRWLMGKTAAMDPARRWVECSVVVVGHERMTDLNQRILRHAGTTDVITFHYATIPGEPVGWRGEVVVNAEQAVDVAGRRGDMSRELALYLAHGCQHLGGADDRTNSERATMNRRQTRWLRQAAAEGLLNGLLKRPSRRD